MKKLLLTLVTCLLFGFTGCEHSRLAFSGSPATPYHRTLQTQTKYQKLFGLEKVLYETYITYKNEKLSEQYVNEYAKIFTLPEEKKSEMLVQEKTNLEKYDEFLVAHYASELDNRTLNENRPDNIVWKFFLVAEDGSKSEPLEITPVVMGTQRTHFYPHLDGWNKLFRIRFAKNASVTKKFIMTGTIRELTFTWKE